MLFAPLKRTLKLNQLRLRGPNEAKDEFLLAAIAQNLRKMAELIPIPTQMPPASAVARLALFKPRACPPPTLTFSTQSAELRRSDLI